MTDAEMQFLRRAIDLSLDQTAANEGGPFGAVIVKDGRIVAEGWNRVTSACDPTAHAEIVAIRNACQALGRFDLQGCEVYASCEPCPMCLAAIYWARLERLTYAADRQDAAAAGFDDEWLYQELPKAPEERLLITRHGLQAEAQQAMRRWLEKEGRIAY